MRWMILGCYSLLSMTFFESAAMAHNRYPIYAAGLSYRKHIEDSAQSYDADKGPLIFTKAYRTLALERGPATVALPQAERVYTELESLESGLGSRLRDEFGENFPYLFDYEAELGIYFRKSVSATELAGESLDNKLSLFAANDFSLRSIQVLGDKKNNFLEYWQVAKGFEGFLPTSRPVKVDRFPLGRWPEICLKTWVNGELRQNDTTADMVFSPRKSLETLASTWGGRIPAGTLFITGTPVGTAFRVSPMKKFLSRFLIFGRLMKLKAALSANEDNPDFLKVGDRVVVEVEGVGTTTTQVITSP